MRSSHGVERCGRASGLVSRRVSSLILRSLVKLIVVAIVEGFALAVRYGLDWIGARVY